jgi:nitrogen fixation/metabolism regulation signal transduction histidine kinase
VKRKLAARLPPVKFDGETLRRVVINLIENAFQAVQARSAKEGSGPYRPLIRVSTSMEDSAIHIGLEDNGIGMTLEDASRAFEPLFTTRPRGTGLGLAVVK